MVVKLPAVSKKECIPEAMEPPGSAAEISHDLAAVVDPLGVCETSSGDIDLW
jgi:hypothetical protein